MQHEVTAASKDHGKSSRGPLLLRRLATAWPSLPDFLGGIGWRLLVRVLFFSSAVTLLLTLVQLYFDYRRDVQAIDLRMSEIDSVYSRSLGDGLWRLDARQLRLQVDGIRRMPDIRYVELREATDGAVPLVVTAGFRQKNPPVRREFRIFYTNRGAERLVGVLVIEATFDGVYRRLLDTAAVIMVSQAIKTFFVSFFILLVVHRLITRHLTAIASSLSGYDLRGSQVPLQLDRRPPRKADELDRLVGAFNRMYVRLQTAYRDIAEREAKIRRLVDSNIIGIFIWDFEGRVLEANDEFLRMVSHDREDLAAGRVRWAELTQPDWRAVDNARIERQKTGGRFEPFEKEFIRKDGSRVPVLIGGATFEQGGNEGVAFVLDLTVHKLAEQALRESELKLRQIIETVPSMLWSASPDGEPTCVNQRILDYGGIRFEDFLNLGWKEFLHPEDFPETRRERSAPYNSKREESYQAVHRLRRVDGQYRWHHARGEPLRDSEQRIIQWYGLSVDIDERKRAEDALRESEAKFRDYAETASDWFWEIGPDYKFTLLTENAFGSDPAQRIGRPCWDGALDVETEPEKWRLVWATLDARESFRDFVYCTLGGSGAPMYVKASGKPVFDNSGSFCGYRGTGTDVTAVVRGQRAEASLRTVQAELAHVSRVMTLGQLTASIAHEVNQPIGSARNNARAAMNFLDRSPPDLGEVREALGCIVADADRAGGIIDRIRDQIKKAPPRNGRFDLNRAIEEVIGLAQSMITENGISVQTRLASGMAPVRGDRVQLQQVVLNLVLNAIEAMSSVETNERELLITPDQSEADRTFVTVRDSGPGIDPKHLERVFEAFYSTKSGMGMGLSICRSIIAAHGGRLWAVSADPRGALFQFTLPGAEIKPSIARPFTTLQSHEKTSL